MALASRLLGNRRVSCQTVRGVDPMHRGCGEGPNDEAPVLSGTRWSGDRPRQYRRHIILVKLLLLR